MKRDDELLDEIISYLRTEEVPEMPQALARHRAAKRPGWLGLVAAGTLAASIGGFLVWRAERVSTPTPRLPDVALHPSTGFHELEVQMLDVDLAAPLLQLEADLKAMDAEIAVLREKASLLDARRKADELLALHQWTQP